MARLKFFCYECILATAGQLAEWRSVEQKFKLGPAYNFLIIFYVNEDEPKGKQQELEQLK